MPASGSKLSSSSFKISSEPNASVYTWPGGTATASVLSLELRARLEIRHGFLNLSTCKTKAVLAQTPQSATCDAANQKKAATCST